MSAVSGVFAKETGYGFAFAMAQDAAASLEAATAPPKGVDANGNNGGPKGDERPKARPSHLQIIK